MTWSKFDDGSRKHPKAVLVGNEAWSFWVGAVQYSNQHLTDGFVPDGALATEILPVALAPKKAKAMAERLVEARVRPEGAGLFERTKGGYLVHDFLDWNPSKAEVEEKRRKDRDRKRGGNGGDDPPSNPHVAPRGSPSGNPRGAPPAFRAEGRPDSGEDSASRAGPRPPPRGRPAQPAQPAPTDPARSKPNNSGSEDLEAGAREETSGGGGYESELIRCPVPLPIEDKTFASLELDVGMARRVAEIALRDWATDRAATTEVRRLDTWISWALSVLRRRWSADKDAMRAAAERDESADRAAREARRSRHEERIRLKNEEATAALAKSGGFPAGFDPAKLTEGIGS